MDKQVNWMETKSCYNQNMYKYLKLAEIIAAAAIPFLVGFHDAWPAAPVITGFLGVLIVVLNGVQQLYKFHENWLAYRGSTETLKREKFYFESEIAPYDEPSLAFKKFVQNFEALLADENKKWQVTWTQKPDSSKPS